MTGFMRKTAFAPIVNTDSKILILGTIPGTESLRRQQYYGHKFNQFWKIIFSLFDEEFSDEYDKRIALLLRHNIALWDVLQSCEGQGSADTDIKNEQANDFDSFFKQYPGIRTVFFASRKAEQFYKKYVGLNNRLTFYTLPSPSTANARMTLQQKIEKWELIKDKLYIK